MDDSEVRRLIAENIKRKETIRALRSQLDALQADYDALRADHDELTEEAEHWLADEEERQNNPSEPVADEVLEELANYRKQAVLSAIQGRIDSSGKFRNGVKAEQIARLKGIDLESMTLEDIDETFGGDLLKWAQSDAPILLGDDKPVATSEPENETNGRSSVSAARRLPTFSSVASGGGAALPAAREQSVVAASLRDPAAAIARATAAREQRQ